ncbi:hypothetical protein ABZ622_36685 [Streptomyces sp. NPDC007164]|uniref:hypothetical protein n=1 Tax=Streptomyces sp. NPDC007164 TaxID=3156918 RepID=UPI0033DC46D2
MRRRIPAILDTFAGGVLLAPMPVSAIAAMGTFEYNTRDGVLKILINRNDDTCYNTDINSPVSNKTNRDFIIFKGLKCMGSSTALLTKGSGNLEGASVQFVRCP